MTHKPTVLLEILGFKPVGGGLWQRRFDYPATGEYVITVDADKQIIDYPAPIELGDRTTCNFDHPENFVVLECVCRLLAKGYDPATLILENAIRSGAAPLAAKATSPFGGEPMTLRNKATRHPC